MLNDCSQGATLDPASPLILLGVVAVAFVFSAVGHGGASGYLALMAFSSLTATQSSTLALSMNLVVSAISFIAFGRAKHFDFSLAWPFLLGGIPLAYVGGLTKLSGEGHKMVLAVVLGSVALILLAGNPPVKDADAPRKPGLAFLVGAGLGWISGLVGIGGGVFLSPLLLLLGWADMKRTAAVSALFIFANSASGLLARGTSGWDTLVAHPGLVACGALGAVVGAKLGANRWSSLILRRVLGLVLIVAVFKLTL